MYEALARLGVPDGRDRARAGLRHREFPRLGPRGHALHRRRARLALRPHRQGPPSRATTSASRTSATRKLPEGSIDAVIGNPPFADVKLDYRGAAVLAARFLLRQVARRPEARRRPGPGHHATYTLDKQNAAVREYLADAGRLPRGDPPAVRRLQARRHARSSPTSCSSGSGPPASRQATPTRTGSRSRRSPSRASRSPSTATSSTTPRWCSGTWSRKDRLYGGEQGYSVAATGDLEDAAPRRRRPAARACAHGGRGRRRGRRPRPSRRRRLERHITEGSFFVGDDRTICQIVDGEAVPVTYGGTLLKADGTMTGKRLAALDPAPRPARRVLHPRTRAGPRRTATRPAAS